MSYEMESHTLLDVIRNFFEYVLRDVFNNDLQGLILHIWGYIPLELRSLLIVGLILTIFVAFIYHIGK